MTISTQFRSIASGSIVRLNSLEIDTRYPVTYARLLVTQYGPTVLLTLQTGENQNVTVFMPNRYAELFTDIDIEEINDSIKNYKLIYRGKRGYFYVLHMEL